MENFKEALIQFSQSNPSLFPNDNDNSYPILIEQCFHQFFADFQTPDHPTYAAMIYKAIWELNKKGGSSEKSISKFIKKEYADLPWAHSTLLKHHLQKLCDGNEIHKTNKQCYLLAGAESEPEKKNSGPAKKRKSRLASKGGKKIGRNHKMHKKMKKCLLDVQETKVKEQTGLHKRMRKQKLKLKKKSSKRMKKHAIKEEIQHLLKEGNLRQDNDESHEQIQILELTTGDMQIQEQNEAGQELHDDNSTVKELIELRKRKRKQTFESKKKSSKRVKKHVIDEEIKHQLLNEANLKRDKDESLEQKQMLELNTGCIQIREQIEAGQESQLDNSGVKEQIGLNKRKRKQGLKSKSKSSKLMKKHVINEEIKLQLNEANFKQLNDESHITNEAGQESHHDDSGQVDLEKIRSNKNPELLLSEDSPDPNRLSHENRNEAGQDSHHDVSGQVDLEQIHTNKIPELLQSEDSPDLNHVSNENRNEAGQELHHDDSGQVDLEQINTNKNPELLLSEGFPDPNRVSHENRKEAGQESHHDDSGQVDGEQINTNKNPEILQSEDSPDPNRVSHDNRNEADQESHHDDSSQVDLEQIHTNKNPELLQSEDSPDPNPRSQGNRNEAGQESHHDDSGQVDLDQIHTNNNPGLLQSEDSPDSNRVSHENRNEGGQESHHDDSDQVDNTNKKPEPRQSEDSPDSNRVSHENRNETGQELHHDDSGQVDLEQIHANKNPEPLQSEDSPDSNHVSHGNSKHVWTRITRSQLKTILKKEASDKPAIVDNLLNEEQQISRSPSSEKPMLKSISAKLTRLSGDEPITSQRSTEKSTVEDKPKYKRRGRPPKAIKPEKNNVLGNSKSAAILRKSRKSAKKGKVVNKQIQPKKKRGVRHTMTRRSSSRKPSTKAI